MAGVRLQWAKFGKVDSFNIYRSSQPIDTENLPPALAVDVVQCEYWDITAVSNKTYYYTVAAKTGLELAVSDEVISIFTENNDFIFVSSEGYIPPLKTNVDFIW